MDSLTKGKVHSDSQSEEVQFMLFSHDALGQKSWQQDLWQRRILLCSGHEGWVEGQKREVRKKEAKTDSFQWRTPSDLFSAVMSHLLKFPELLKILPHYGNQSTKAWTWGGGFYIQTTWVFLSSLRLSGKSLGNLMVTSWGKSMVISHFSSHPHNNP